MRHFIISAHSMENSIFKGDMLIGKKHKDVNRNEIVIFRYPLKPEIFYIKRLVAKAGDEVIFLESKIFIHFVEGDEYINKNYPKRVIKRYREKLWVENPYMRENKNIHYTIPPDRNRSVFQIQLLRENKIEAIFLEDDSLEVYEQKNSKKINAFYFKVSEDHYFMMGDNREASNDSRFWGELHKNYIYGIPELIYF